MIPHNPCIWNKYIIKNQMTIVFHIDDLMIVHLQSQIIAEHVTLINRLNGSKHPMTISWGKAHGCLGVTLDFRLKRGVDFSQYHFTNTLWLDLPVELWGNYRNAPANDHSLEEDKNDALVDAKKKKNIIWQLMNPSILVNNLE